MKCRRGYEIKPLKSGAGWYLGTLDEDGFPNCRISVDYAKSEEEALKLSQFRDYAMEVQFCNKGLGCIVED